jgi:MFS family permease
MQREPVQTRRRFFYGYWILLVGFLCLVISQGCGGYAFSLFVLPLADKFGWSRGTIMVGNLMWLLSLGLASPFVGRLINRWGTKWVIVAGALLMGTGFMLISLIQALWQFYLLWVVIGIGAGAAGVVPASTMVNNWFKKRRGFAIGILGAGIGVGGFVIPWILSNYIFPGFPNLTWRAGYLFSGIISVVIIIPLAIWIIKEAPPEKDILPESDRHGETKTPRISDAYEPGLKLAQAWKTQAFWLLIVGFVTFGFAANLVFQNQVPHLQDIGFTAIQAAISMQALGIGSAIGKFAFGWLCDYIQPKYTLIIGSIIQAGALVILMIITTSSPLPLLWTYGILIGLGYGCWLPALSMNTTFYFGLVAYSVIFGIYNFLFAAGCAIGPVTGGYIFDRTGSYHLAFILCFIFYAICVLTMLFVRRTTAHKKIQEVTIPR